jgi:hypothetical protein
MALRASRCARANSNRFRSAKAHEGTPQTPELQLRERNANLLYTQAAHSPWECARLFSTHSNEISLAGHVPGDCVELLYATVVTTGISELPYG